MAKRFPYDSNQQQAMQAALEMEEALYLQRQQELQRDLQIQRMLLQEQLEQQTMLRSSGNPPMGNHPPPMGSIYGYPPPYGGTPPGLSLAAAHHMREEQLRYQQQQQQQEQQQEVQLDVTPPSTASASSQMPTAQDLAVADARASMVASQRKRELDAAAAEEGTPAQKRTARANSVTSEQSGGQPKKRGRGRPRKQKPPSPSPPGDGLTQETVVQDETDLVASSLAELAHVGHAHTGSPSQVVIVRESVEDLLKAAESEEKDSNAAECIKNLKESVVWSDSEPEEDEVEVVKDGNISEESDDDNVFVVGSFKSKLPQLPKEPEFDMSTLSPPKKVAAKKAAPAHATTNGTMDTTAPKDTTANGTAAAPVDYPYPIDTWWPSIEAIRKERRMNGEQSDEDDFVDELKLSSEDQVFRGDARAIRQRLATDFEPGVLEKIPHCKIHRVKMKKMKIAPAPDHVFCWQVTEGYCNEPMVCCSICSTWRHAACGGHYKPLTIRDTTEHAFAAVCDRCHAEQTVLQEYPKAQARIDRQRVQHLRRSLATSSAVRHASFAKHGGAYKWPLGCVSITHINGHTRSVHTRHDKAEKQWTDMVARLAKRSPTARPNDRIKMRSRELERLLVSVDDSEGMMDRHNMMLFLQRDTDREHPVGYEKRRQNIFDPEDDEIVQQVEPSADARTKRRSTSLVSDKSAHLIHHSLLANRPRESGPTTETETCARLGCTCKPRVDSIFCSDACGVSALEMDICKSLQYCSEIHPTALRS